LSSASMLRYRTDRGQTRPDLDLLKRALEIRGKNHGPEGIEVVFSLRALADVYYKQERYDEAEVLLQRALKIIERRFGVEHPNIIPILESYELLLQKTNRDAEAKSLEERIAIIRRKSVKENPRGKIP
jgi:tetratricopeptide (TPR) repeat protein